MSTKNSSTIAASPTLCQFFTSGYFGREIMDRLPLVKQGYMLPPTATMLFTMYVHQHQLSHGGYVKADSFMTSVFGGNIPAAFYAFRDSNNKCVKVTMDVAIKNKLVSRPLNTFTILTSLFPARHDNMGCFQGFTVDKFNRYFIQNIVSLNYFTSKNMPSDVFDALHQEDVMGQMIKEHDIVKKIMDETKKEENGGGFEEERENERENEQENEQEGVVEDVKFKFDIFGATILFLFFVLIFAQVAKMNSSIL
jgi:hypothetical protein